MEELDICFAREGDKTEHKLEEDFYSDSEEEFCSSELGTKKYWVETYTQELKTFNQNGDIGDIWYGEESHIRIIDWMKSNIASIECSIIDIGCGNGITLSCLADEGFKNLFGVDYCKEAIELAKGVAIKRATPIQYEVANILEIGSECGSQLLSRTYDICHDKGTYDAISLAPEEPKLFMEIYMKAVYDLLNPDGLFILTSCNWTEAELLNRVKKHFVKHAIIPTPIFQFGGKIGSSVTSIVLKKKTN